MANYVSGNIVSQSYIHVNPKWLHNLSPQEKKIRIAEIESQITDFASTRIPFFLGSNVQIIIEFTEGSIKAKITTFAKIATFISSVVIAYPAFSEGIKAMVKDAHELGNYLNAELLFQTNAKKKSERMSVESRLGIIGVINRVNEKIDELERVKNQKNMPPSLIYEKLLSLHDSIITSLDKISEKDRDGTDTEITIRMWIDGMSNLNLGRSHFRFSKDGDKDFYNKLLQEKDNIVNDLKKAKSKAKP